MHYERVPTTFQIRSSGANGVPDYTTNVSKNALLVAKLYAPILNHPHLKLILGFNYERQEFQFEEQSSIDQYGLYNNIQNKGLTTIARSWPCSGRSMRCISTYSESRAS